MGPKLSTHLEGLRPAQKESLKQGFDEIDGVNPGDTKGFDDNPKQVISTNINPHG